MKNKEYMAVTKMIEYIDLAEKYTQGFEYEEFIKDDKSLNATIFVLSQIGELVKNISEETQKKYNYIEWRLIKNLRNKIVHDYEGLQYKIIWAIIKEDISELRKNLQEMIKEEK